jgi:hypothetical protein
LRKFGKEINVVKLSVSVNSLSFDRYGGFLLAGAGSVVSNHAAKKWDEAPLYVNKTHS